MSAGNLSISPENSLPSPVAPASHEPTVERSGHVLNERWPALGQALGRYQRKVADDFSTMAYEAVQGGIIRLDERRRLASAAEQSGIRPFDAQLLIACALRQWVLDHNYNAAPSKEAPPLSFEYQSWKRMWVRVALVGGLAVALDAMIVWKWLS